MSQIGGWNVVGVSGANAMVTATKKGVPQRQHIIYSIDAGFSAAPAASIAAQLVCPDVSPNIVLWEGYISGAQPRNFPAGITGPMGATVALVLGAGGGALVGNVNMHGITR